ncbi:MAG TPA: TRAP transporter small permease [Zeimonas sp.]|nr:TRAP transporter small permease [Zeimonas sp.]
MPAPAGVPTRFESLLFGCCRICAWIGVVILIACALLTVADVVLRRVAGDAIPGMVDITQLMVMTGVFLCIPYVFEQRANVEVELVHERLPGWLGRALTRLWSLVSMLFLVAIAWYVGIAAGQVLEYGDRSPTVAIPMIWYWAPILFGTIVSAVVCLLQVVRGESAR